MTSKKSRDWFESIASEGPWYPTAESIVELAEIKNSDLVLDVGSGFGDLTIELKTLGADVVAVDFSHLYVHRLKRNVSDVALVMADATHLPFKKEVFDKVVTKSVWQNMVPEQSRTRFVAELGRVTKKGGLVVVSAFWNKMYCYLNPWRFLFKPPRDDEFHHYFMPSEVKSAFRKADLEIITLRSSPMPFRNTLPLIARFLSPWYSSFYLDAKAVKGSGHIGRNSATY